MRAATDVWRMCRADRASRGWSTLRRRVACVGTWRVSENSRCKARTSHVVSPLRSSPTTASLANFGAPCSDKPAGDRPIQHPTRSHPSYALPSKCPHRFFSYGHMASRRGSRAPARHPLRTGTQNDREGLETLPTPSAQKTRRGIAAQVRMHEESNAGA